MIINFVGLFNASGYVGEISDETHIARELERLGHTVNKVQRDIWKAWCDGESDPSWNLPVEADINLIAKWHHFNDGKYIHQLRQSSHGAPVFYWVWDFMWDHSFPDWHMIMAMTADLYLSGEAGVSWTYEEMGVNFYYFQMDVCDGDLPIFDNLPKIHDVIFTGDFVQQGHRIEWLQQINKEIPVKIWGPSPDRWRELGFEAYDRIFGEDYNKLIAQSKIVLGFSVEPNCWGYWSNRVGKVLRAGGFLLQEYAPGMETQLPSCVKYFSSSEEAVGKIKWYLESESRTRDESHKSSLEGYKFTSAYRCAQLAKLMERYLKGEPSKWNQLPSTI